MKKIEPYNSQIRAPHNRKKTERNIAPVKNYITSCSTGACPFKFSYNFYMYTACLKCEWCYKEIPGAKVRVFSPHLIDVEAQYNKNLYKVPIIVSKFYDPLYNNTSMAKSEYFMEKVLDNGGQIILRTALTRIPDSMFNLMVKYKNDVQYQPIVFSDNSTYGKILRNEFKNKYSDIEDAGLLINRFKESEIDVVANIHPFIPYINDHACIGLADKLKSFGISKIIVSQLFATDFFKNKLSIYSPLARRALSQECNGYWTYDNKLLIRHILPLAEYCSKENIKLSFCNNAELNKLFNSFNCCQFDNVKYMFDYNAVKNIGGKSGVISV